MILKFYRKVYFSDTEACQGLHLFPLCDVMTTVYSMSTGRRISSRSDLTLQQQRSPARSGAVLGGDSLREQTVKKQSVL